MRPSFLQSQPRHAVLYEYSHLLTPKFLQPTGRESLVERWVLHNLNIAAAEINTNLTDRNFMLATTAAYNFWLYELCDVYIVRPIQV